MHIGIVAGEVSGDVLGAGLMQALKARAPDIAFVGIGGPRMQAMGCRSLFPMEELSVIGFESLLRYPAIVGIRRRLAEYFTADPPDLFIGVDVPDFNLVLEARLKAAGVPTVHYVSPTVWAWRGYRIRKIHRAVDHMLTLFPFEADYYKAHAVPVTFVGHPLADEIPLQYDGGELRRALALPPDRTLVALLPGSRMNELKLHADVFVETAQRLAARHPDWLFAAPFANEETRALFEQALERHGAEGLPITRLLHRSREVMGASDIVLTASGTATLEAALLKKPMVVMYRLSRLSYFLIRLFSHVDLYSLPNNLAGRQLVPELIQSDAQPEKLAHAVEHYLAHPQETHSIVAALEEMHRALRRNANVTAAEAVLKFLAQAPSKSRLAAVT